MTPDTPGQDSSPRPRIPLWRWIALVLVGVLVAVTAGLFLARRHSDSGPFSIQRSTVRYMDSAGATFGPPQSSPRISGEQAVSIARRVKPPGFVPVDGGRITATYGHLVWPYPPAFNGDVWLVTAHDLCLPRDGFYRGPAQWDLTDHIVVVDAQSGRLVGGTLSTGSLVACPQPPHA
jgi:hypothetical protein